MLGSGEAVRRCPVCRYDLRGLPEAHRCPECGFEYDETMRIWRVPVVPPWVRVALVFVTFAVLDVWLWPELRWTRKFQRSEASLIVAVLALLPAIVLSFCPKGWIAMGRSGLSYRFPIGRARILPWAQVRITPIQKIALRVGPDGSKEILMMPTFGLSWRKRRLFHAEIERR